MKSIEAPARSSTGVTPESTLAAKKIVAIIGAESPAGLGLTRAIVEDLKSEFVPRAIVRSLDSAESRQLRKLGTELLVADPRDQSALARVLGGAYGAFYIQLSSEHSSTETKLATAHTVAHAAKEVGLRHVIWATLEDPGQTFLEHNDVTPTFQNGRWISDGEGQKRPEQIFTEMEIPTTFLHTAWEATVAAGKWTEDIGKHAYGLLRDRDSIGQTVSISAARMTRRPTPAPIPVPAGKSEPVTVPSLATLSSTTSTTTSSSSVRAFAVPAILPAVEPVSIKSAPAPAKSRKIAMTIGLVVVGAVVGMVVMRQVQSQKVVPAPAPIESPRAAEAVPPPPVAIKQPEAPVVVPPPVTATPPVAASPEPPPPPAAEVAPPEEMVVAINEHAAGKHSAAGKNHKHPVLKAGAVASAAAPAPPAPESPPAVAPVKTEAPPKIETPPVRAAPPAPAVAAERAPAPKPPAVAPSAPPVPRAATTPQSGFVDPKAVNVIVRSHADEANACYERAIMEHPDLHGRVIIHAVIDPNGRVASVSPTGSISDGARLQSCLVRAFKNWVFPRPAGAVNGNITYSFSFESP